MTGIPPIVFDRRREASCKTPRWGDQWGTEDCNRKALIMMTSS
ncbi:hypothetical protein CIPAW_04G115400 [Carya illinoinensis]|uniref:Uncharacterized protein n=1 Tax=Carya illinoinensis TaxID=32201 RepID=A0A8T1QUX3_CARIL|nr:hypothetical protein CIPAW_04G115400 [Carya illinoinensis]